jgi:hypothetical protein
MKEVMPKRGINRTQPMEFIPNRKNGADCYNRVEMRKLVKKAKDYRGNFSRKGLI